MACIVTMCCNYSKLDSYSIVNLYMYNRLMGVGWVGLVLMINTRGAMHPLASQTECFTI